MKKFKKLLFTIFAIQTLCGCTSLTEVEYPENMSRDRNTSYKNWTLSKISHYEFTCNSGGNFSVGRSKSITVKKAKVTAARYNRDAEFVYNDKYFKVKKGQLVHSFEYIPTIEILFQKIFECYKDEKCVVKHEKYHNEFGFPIHITIGSRDLEDGDYFFGIRNFKYKNEWT